MAKAPSKRESRCGKSNGPDVLVFGFWWYALFPQLQVLGSVPATSMPPSNSCEGLGRAGSTWCGKHGPRTDRWSEHHVSIQKETENARSRTGSWKTVESMQEDVESESNWSNCRVESRPWCSSSSGCPGRAQHHWRCGNSHSLVKNSWSWNRCSTCPATKPTRSSSFSIHSPIPSPIQKQNIPIPNGPKYMVSSPTSKTVSGLREIYVIWNGDGINDSWLAIIKHSIYIHVYIHIDIDIYIYTIYILYIYVYLLIHIPIKHHVSGGSNFDPYNMRRISPVPPRHRSQATCDQGSVEPTGSRYAGIYQGWGCTQQQMENMYCTWCDGMAWDVCLSVCMHVCMHVCAYIYIYIYICIYTCYIYTYIHIISIYVYCIWCICINTSIRVCPGPGFRAFGRHCHGRRGWMPRVLPSWRFRTAWPGSIVSWGYHGDIMGIWG